MEKTDLSPAGGGPPGRSPSIPRGGGCPAKRNFVFVFHISRGKGERQVSVLTNYSPRASAHRLNEGERERERERVSSSYIITTQHSAMAERSAPGNPFASHNAPVTAAQRLQQQQQQQGGGGEGGGTTVTGMPVSTTTRGNNNNANGDAATAAQPLPPPPPPPMYQQASAPSALPILPPVVQTFGAGVSGGAGVQSLQIARPVFHEHGSQHLHGPHDKCCEADCCCPFCSCCSPAAGEGGKGASIVHTRRFKQPPSPHLFHRRPPPPPLKEIFLSFVKK